MLSVGEECILGTSNLKWSLYRCESLITQRATVGTTGGTKDCAQKKPTVYAGLVQRRKVERWDQIHYEFPRVGELESIAIEEHDARRNVRVIEHKSSNYTGT
jgi:hypothetical protein